MVPDLFPGRLITVITECNRPRSPYLPTVNIFFRSNPYLFSYTNGTSTTVVVICLDVLRPRGHSKVQEHTATNFRQAWFEGGGRDDRTGSGDEGRVVTVASQSTSGRGKGKATNSSRSRSSSSRTFSNTTGKGGDSKKRISIAGRMW